MRLASIAALLFAAAPIALAQGPTDEVLAQNATVKVTRADYDADLERVPFEMRAAFASDPRRVSQLINNLLVGKTLAAEARKAGVDDDPLVKRRVALEADKILAEVQIRRIEEAAAAEFDAKAAQFLLKARERYLVDKDKFRVAEQVSVSHIVFDTKKRSPEAALALAQETQSKLTAGADFSALAKELSDDSRTSQEGGKVGWVAASQLDPALAKAAFELKNVGDVSAPVLSQKSYHLIRLDDRRPERVRSFDEVKNQLMGDLRQSFINEQRDGRLAAIHNDPTTTVNQPAISALIVPMPDLNAFRRVPQEPK